MGSSLGANRPRHRYRPHGRSSPAAKWWWIFPPKNWPTKRRFTTPNRASRPIFKAVREFTLAGVPELRDAAAAFGQLLAWPTIASKNWVYRQYDHMVRDGSVVCPAPMPPSSASRRIPCPRRGRSAGRAVEKFIAMSVDCNAAYVYLDPYEGRKSPWPKRRGIWPVPAPRRWARRTISISPTRTTRSFSGNCKESVRGLAEACRVFQRPGDRRQCSLYNQSPNGPIDPTPPWPWSA